MAGYVRYGPILSKIDNKGYALGSGDFGINKSCHMSVQRPWFLS